MQYECSQYMKKIEDWYDLQLDEKEYKVSLDEHQRFLKRYLLYKISNSEQLRENLEVEGDIENPMAIVLKRSQEGRENYEEIERKIEEKVGFRRLWKAIYERGVPMVGHNCMLDLMFMYSHFENKLPPTLTQFKQYITDLFPR